MPKLVVKSLKLIIKIILKGRYIGNVWRALNYYKDLFKEPVIIAGDFNWNVIWDNVSYRLYIYFTKFY